MSIERDKAEWRVREAARRARLTKEERAREDLITVMLNESQRVTADYLIYGLVSCAPRTWATGGPKE